MAGELTTLGLAKRLAIAQGGGASTLGPTSATVASTATAGTVIAAITGLASDETIVSVVPNDGRLALDSTRRNLIVGMSAISVGAIAAALTTSIGRILNMAITVGNPSIGGIAIGSQGASGTFRAGYTLSGGDDFAAALSIVSPSNPKGDYFATRAYVIQSSGQTPRGSNGLKGYNVDPSHTGYLDKNRGAINSSWADLITSGSSSVKLKSRAATADEKALTDGKDLLSSMLHTAGVLTCRPPCIMEICAVIPADFLANKGWHPTLWNMLTGFCSSYNSIELDFEALDTVPQKFGPNGGLWTPPSTAVIATGGVDNYDILPATWDGSYHIYSFEILLDRCNYYVDDVLCYTRTFDMTSKGGRAAYLLMTNHVVDFSAQYALADWQARGNTGNTLEVDWHRMWRTTGTVHRAPLIQIPDINLPFGDSTTVTIPSNLDLWGDAAVDEALEVINNEVIAPGGNTNGGFVGLPSFVSYASKTLTINPSDKAGRMYFVVNATKAGETCKPARFVANIGPRLRQTSLQFSFGTPITFDMYANVDCGDLLPFSHSVGALPAGLTYNPATGLATYDGTTTIAGASVGQTIINVAGQPITPTMAIKTITSIPSPVTTGLLVSYDPELASSITQSGGAVDSISGADGTTYAATSSGTNRPTLVTRGLRKALSFTAAGLTRLDVATGAAVAAGQTYTIVMVVELPTTGLTQTLMELANPAGSTSTSRESIYVAAGGTIRSRRANSSTFQDASDTRPTGVMILFKTVTAGTTKARIGVNRNTEVDATTAIADPATITAMTIGARRTGGGTPVYDANADQFVYSIKVHTGVLSDADKNTYRDWASTNFGTP